MSRSGFDSPRRLHSSDLAVSFPYRFLLISMPRTARRGEPGDQETEIRARSSRSRCLRSPASHFLAGSWHQEASTSGPDSQTDSHPVTGVGAPAGMIIFRVSSSKSSLYVMCPRKGGFNTVPWEAIRSVGVNFCAKGTAFCLVRPSLGQGRKIFIRCE
jgi:hypothetical protein